MTKKISRRTLESLTWKFAYRVTAGPQSGAYATAIDEMGTEYLCRSYTDWATRTAMIAYWMKQDGELIPLMDVKADERAK